MARTPVASSSQRGAKGVAGYEGLGAGLTTDDAGAGSKGHLAGHHLAPARQGTGILAPSELLTTCLCPPVDISLLCAAFLLPSDPAPPLPGPVTLFVSTAADPPLSGSLVRDFHLQNVNLDELSRENQTAKTALEDVHQVSSLPLPPSLLPSLSLPLPPLPYLPLLPFPSPPSPSLISLPLSFIYFFFFF